MSGPLRTTLTALLVDGLAVVAALGAAGPAAATADHTLEQAISDRAQSTTIAFSGLAVITGNLEAQSFFPPGKVADYFGFQYLRDNDPSDMGHNTSFLTRAACNVLHTLSDAQVAELAALASGQLDDIDQYGYDRYPLMRAFRRLVDADPPAGTTGLSESALVSASRDLYVLDGQMSYERAVAYADVIRSLSSEQRAYLDAMVGKGWSDWPAVDETDSVVAARLKALPGAQRVAVMTYAGDIFSWYAGSLAADVYFCPERHGTYYGGFYIKDAPAVGVPGYSISEQLTATAGSAICDPAQGYVSSSQAELVTALVDRQRANLYAGTQSIVQARTDIATALRSLLVATPSAATLAQVKAAVLALSAEYGELDGEDNYAYARAFAALDASLTDAQRTKLADLRHSLLSGTYSGGAAFDFTTCTTPYLYSAKIADTTVLAPYLAAGDALFAAVAAPAAAFTWAPSAPLTGAAVQFTDTSSGSTSAWAWTFGDGGTSAAQNPTHDYALPGSYTVTLTVTGPGGTDATTRTVVVAPATPAIAVTAPLLGAVWCVGSGQTVAWTVGTAVAYGEFRVGLVGSGGTRYLDRQVLPVAGRTAYSTSMTVSVSAAAGYTASVQWRPAVGSGAWTAAGTSAAFSVVAPAPVITVTSPKAGASVKVKASLTVGWSLSTAVSAGEFRVGVVSASGAVSLDKQVLPVAGRKAYTTVLAMSVAAGTGYRVYVYWRPVIGSGAWAATALSGAFTVKR